MRSSHQETAPQHARFVGFSSQCSFFPLKALGILSFWGNFYSSTSCPYHPESPSSPESSSFLGWLGSCCPFLQALDMAADHFWGREEAVPDLGLRVWL